MMSIALDITTPALPCRYATARAPESLDLKSRARNEASFEASSGLGALKAPSPEPSSVEDEAASSLSAKSSTSVVLEGEEGEGA